MAHVVFCHPRNFLSGIREIVTARLSLRLIRLWRKIRAGMTRASLALALSRAGLMKNQPGMTMQKKDTVCAFTFSPATKSC
ncbi:MAG: hypothetical protein A2Z83_00430 [Omnitrophica bacterium GWA2_52_8]|nr:MAG: hypothetical protein A2Z83_00430 [Omnitrophica bacterium GWA2_52_8]